MHCASSLPNEQYSEFSITTTASLLLSSSPHSRGGALSSQNLRLNFFLPPEPPPDSAACPTIDTSYRESSTCSAASCALFVVEIVRHDDGLRTSQWHVHLGRDFPQHVQLHLELAGARTGLTMRVSDEKKAFFPDRAANNLCPGDSQLAAIPLKSGYNQGRFCVEEVTDGTCTVLGSIAVGVFVWDASDRVIVAAS